MPNRTLRTFGSVLPASLKLLALPKVDRAVSLLHFVKNANGPITEKTGRIVAVCNQFAGCLKYFVRAESARNGTRK